MADIGGVGIKHLVALGLLALVAGALVTWSFLGVTFADSWIGVWLLAAYLVANTIMFAVARLAFRRTRSNSIDLAVGWQQ
ncbi:MAG: hypothetical protein LC118_07755 [Dehalococcoidia bacterium]|nr:hypothetical protein [Dehalococcoidia bacterium]